MKTSINLAALLVAFVTTMSDVAQADGAPVTWKPNPGPQTRFLSLGCYEALYGGAAGGGKSDALLTGALRYVHIPSYTAIIFRRTFPELEKTIMARASAVIPAAFPAARYREQKKFWKFPSGARLYFGHLEFDANVTEHQGAEYQYIGFDELTHFTEKQYRYLLSRGRSSAGVPVRIRGGTNPGGEGHEWVFRRWAPWLDPESTVKAKPGEVLHYLPDTGEYVPKGTVVERSDEGPPRMVTAESRCFVPARLADNPRMDDGYGNRLAQLDAVTRAQQRDGDWLVKPAAGLLFKRSWFQVVEAVPATARRIRYWDRAATDGGGDWTRGVRMARSPEGLYYVEHVESVRGRPAEVERVITQTAQLDGRGVEVGIEKDAGGAGKFEADYYVRALAGFTVKAYPVAGQGKKVTRAQPYSAQVEAGNVHLVRGAWNEPYITELEGFPDATFDDQVDASSGAFAVLSSTKGFFLV